MKNRMRKQVSRVLALAGLLALAAAAQQTNITLKGSDTMVILGQRWAEEYMTGHPGATVQVTGGGSGTGIASLINGTTHIAQSSRPMKSAEKGQVRARQGAEVLELPVAVDGLAVYVHQSNPITELTMEQIRLIYIGAITRWSQLGGPDKLIILYSRENNSGTYVFFKEHVLRNADFHPRTMTLPGTAAVINAISYDPQGIGYGGIAYGHRIRPVLVRKDADSPGVEPTLENVLAARYPISRHLFWYFAGRPEGQVRDFVTWVLSDDGQQVVENVGYYPLNEPDRAVARAKLAGGEARGAAH
jgi:phosphate transport system substrate-binding protein